MINLYIKGLALGLSLIAAIGPQNAFILKNGIRKRFVFITPLVTSICDTILIIAGVFGIGQFLNNYFVAKILLMLLGAIFLFIFAGKCFLNVFEKSVLTPDKSHNYTSLRRVILYAIAVSFLNPHAILDSLIIIGSLSTKYDFNQSLYFAAGLITSSTLWFFSISILASTFSKYLARPMVWKVIDFSVFIICTTIAISLTKDIIIAVW